jgi:hypothetical protein
MKIKKPGFIMPLTRIYVAALIVLTGALQLFAEINNYYEMCDASAALAVDDEHFIIANDEDSILRIYHIDEKKPVSTFDLSAFFNIRYDDKSPESDIEGAARIGDYYFFITSHGRDRKGRLRKNRHQFFAVTVNPHTRQISPVGVSCQRLMDTMMHNKELKKIFYDAYQPNDKKNDRILDKNLLSSKKDEAEILPQYAFSYYLSHPLTWLLFPWDDAHNHHKIKHHYACLCIQNV